ncbi:MAG: tRNA (adenosine(37)-N6)-threonylcarbamoyltransferase complex transferase subunit TsaD [Patescibacteria group bacterium]
MSRNKKITILGIETSCDETAIAVVDASGGLGAPKFRVRANVISSQIKIHAPYGGVVPNLAKREHIRNLPIILEQALRKAGIGEPHKEINAIAVTTGPGLEPALWTGITFTQKLAEEWNLPVVAANHMEGHLVTPLLNARVAGIAFPAIALLVSGGHTEIVLVKKWGDYKVLGETVDDAAGEAFDKVARMLELPYPGGPEVSRLARTGNRYGFSFPRPMLQQKNYNFSFSGLKTAVLYQLRDLKEQKTPFSKNDIAASFEDAVIDVLMTKTMRAAAEHKAPSIIIGGGVAANARLRARMRDAVKKEKQNRTLYLAPLSMTGDNAAMIAASAYFHAVRDDFANWKKLEAHATLPL